MRSNIAKVERIMGVLYRCHTEKASLMESAGFKFRKWSYSQFTAQDEK